MIRGMRQEFFRTRTPGTIKDSRKCRTWDPERRLGRDFKEGATLVNPYDDNDRRFSRE